MKNLLYAFRYLIKSRGNNITRIISITLGLAVSLLVFSYLTFEASYDRFMPDKERIHQLWFNYDVDGFKDISGMINAPYAPAMQADFPQVEAATRYPNPFPRNFSYDTEIYNVRSTFADSMFFEVLDYGVLRGDPKKILADKGQVMISESFARTVFGEKDPLGEIIIYEATQKYPLTVGGVFRDIPKNTQMGTFDLLFSFELAHSFYQTSWHGGDSFPSFIKLRPGANIGEIEAMIGEFTDRYGVTDELNEWNMTIFFTPLTKSHQTASQAGSLTLILAIIAFVTLFIAAMNYVLISISMLLRRGKTMAMLKCNGASRGNILSISLWETFFILILSVILAILLIMAVKNPLESVLGVSLSDLFAWERIWAPLAVILVMFALAGFIPARISASIPVSTAFKGSVPGKRGWKKVLLFIQLLIVTFVVTFLIISMRQFNYMANSNYGYDHRNLLYTSLVGTPSMLDTYKNELASIPEIESVGASQSMPIWGYSGMPAYDEITRELLFSCRFDVIDHNYIPTMRMNIIEGRNFTNDEGVDKVIVNREYTRLRGWPEGTAVGRQIIDNNEAGTPIYTIVGVVDDFWMGYGGSIMPLVWHTFNEYQTREDRNYRSGYIMMRVNNVSPRLINTLTDKIKGFYDDDRDFKVESYEVIFQSSLSEVKLFRNLMLVVSLVALLIALMGLIGYINDEINRRRKEIAIRKVNGAERADVIGLIARDTAIMTLPAVIVGVTGAFFLGRMLLTMFPQKTPLHWWIFVLGALAVIAVVYVVELARTWKISGSNPVDSIKPE